jgi:hypothetical protein
MRREQANRVDSTASMSGMSSLVRIKAVADSPIAPDTSDSRGAVDEHAVEVEKNPLYEQR